MINIDCSSEGQRCAVNDGLMKLFIWIIGYQVCTTNKKERRQNRILMGFLMVKFSRMTVFLEQRGMRQL